MPDPQRSLARPVPDLFLEIQDAVQDLHRRVDALLGRWPDALSLPVLHGFSIEPRPEGAMLVPFGDLLEDMDALTAGWRRPYVSHQVTDDEVVVQAELPGLNREDIRIDLTETDITLEGEHLAAGDPATRRFRTTLVPGVTMDPQKLTTRHEAGVLELRVRRGHGKPRHVELD